MHMPGQIRSLINLPALIIVQPCKANSFIHITSINIKSSRTTHHPPIHSQTYKSRRPSPVRRGRGGRPVLLSLSSLASLLLRPHFSLAP
jgi:hypothetical protein